MLLHDLDGWTHPEIGEELGISAVMPEQNKRLDDLKTKRAKRAKGSQAFGKGPPGRPPYPPGLMPPMHCPRHDSSISDDDHEPPNELHLFDNLPLGEDMETETAPSVIHLKPGLQSF